MTGEAKTDAQGNAIGAASLLPFNPADLVAMRVRPAEFARMVQVSKQTVSRWIREGKIVLGPDGRLDPAKAVREVLERTDPARLRARLFKSASESREELRSRAESAEAALRAEQRERMQLEAELVEALEETPERFIGMIASMDSILGDASKAGCSKEWLEAIWSEAIVPGWLGIAVDDSLHEALRAGNPLREATERALAISRQGVRNGE